MSIEYRYVVDESYIRESFGHSRTRLPLFFRSSVVVPAMILAVSIGWYVLYQAGLNSLILPLVIAAIVAAAGNLIMPVLLRRAVLKHVKRRPDFGREVTTILSDEGIESTAPLSQGIIKWAAVDGAIRDTEGIVLKIGPMKMWLPDTALTGSASHNATSFVSSKIKFDQG